MKYKESYYNIEIEIDENKRILVFNTVTNALSWFTSEVYETFHNKSEIESDKLIPAIIECGFVVSSTIDELSEIKYTNRIFAYNRRPGYLHFVIAPTMKCNYKCIYCFEKNYSCGEIMSAETIEATYKFVINQIESFQPNRGIHIQWFGGEPLLALNEIETLSKEIIAYLDKNHLDYLAYIVTNAFLLTKDVAERLKAIRVTGAQITLDGTKDQYTKLKGCTPEAFNIVVQNIYDVQRLLSINIRLNVNDDNKEDMKDLVRYLTIDKKINAKIYIADIRSYDSCIDGKLNTVDFELYREEIIEYAKLLGVKNLSTQLPSRRYASCEAATIREYVIGPTGNIYRCAHLLDRMGMDSGNVYSGYEHKKVDVLFFDNDLPAKCNECKIMPICMGGCLCDRCIDGIELNCSARLMNLKYEVKQAMLSASK